MPTRQATPKWLEIDKYVEAYEEAHAASGRADLGDHLPPPEHPFFVAILGELVRVDLELAWVRGRPLPLEDYVAAFPCLREDSEVIQQLAFEHYRQRGEHGDAPTREEYRAAWGVDVRDWPPPEVFGRDGGPASALADAPGKPGASGAAEGAIHEASRAYERYRLGPARGDSSAFQSLWTSLRIPEGVAELFRDLHASDPNSAWRLARASAALPVVGEAFLDFLLLGELGRGAFGRVYLARQMSLADRLVVLKVSTDLMGESGTLAQLQHTNIVPIYSVHQASPLQAVCMPYFGATTLADVLEELRGLSALPSSGRYLVSTIHGRQAGTLLRASAAGATAAATRPDANAPGSARVAPVPAPLAPDTLDKLEKATYIDAVLWLGARLAEGLAHAHARGIFHHDLKPANVLLADDGQPMLLDFNLAEDTKLRNKATAVHVGGTLPYMAPEHLDALRGGRRPGGAQGDTYALGLILFELLTGRHPFDVPTGPLPEVLAAMSAERRQPPPRLRALNRAVSPAVEAVVRRCLEPDPAARYPSAAHLREDLDRHLAQLPLKHTAEPSPRERFRKWRRRHPRLTSLTGISIAGTILLAVLAATAGGYALRLARHQAREQRHAFLGEKGEVEALVSIVRDNRDPLPDFRQRARRLLARYEVGTHPQWMDRPAIRNLEPGERASLCEEIGNLTFCLARAEGAHALRAADGAGRREGLDEALRLNALAHACFDDARRPAALRWQHDDLQRLLQPGAATHEPPPAEPRTARDAYLLAFALCEKGKYAEALPLAARAVARDPQLFAAQFLLGRCYLHLGQDLRAEHAYGTCIALWPEFPWAYYNRGIARHRLRAYAAAREDFDRVLELHPDAVEAIVERGQVRQGEKDYRGAVADFTRALELGAPPTNLHLLRARAYTLAGDKAAAKQDLEAGLRDGPRDEQGWVARGLARLPGDPAGAVADFDAALALNPRSRPARQNKAYVLSELLQKIPESVAVLDDVLRDDPEYLPSLGGRGVLLARLGKREAAHADAEACLRLSKRPETLYQVAGVYALTSRQVADDRREAYRLLAAAFAERGYGLDLVDRDTDLDPIRDQAEFRRIVSAARFLQGAARGK